MQAPPGSHKPGAVGMFEADPVSRRRPCDRIEYAMKLQLDRASALRFAGFVLISCAFASLASAQTFQFAPLRIPQGAPFNNSYTENVDFADVDLDGDWDAVFADGGDFGNDQNRLWINMGGAQGGTLGVFEDRTATHLPGVLDDSRAVEFVDVDEDGDADAFGANTAPNPDPHHR